MACRHKTNIPSYLTVTRNYLFLFKCFEKRGAQKSVFQDYFKKNQIVESSDYTKIFHRNIEGA